MHEADPRLGNHFSLKYLILYCSDETDSAFAMEVFEEQPAHVLPSPSMVWPWGGFSDVQFAGVRVRAKRIEIGGGLVANVHVGIWLRPNDCRQAHDGPASVTQLNDVKDIEAT